MRTFLIIAMIATASICDLSCGAGKDENCLLCTAAGACTACIYSGLAADGICKVPATKIENCGSYDTAATACTGCKGGYTLSAEKTCVANTVANCYTQVSTKCTTCNGYALKTDGTCDAAVACTAGCLSCTKVGDVETCTACATGSEYYMKMSSLTAFTCVKAEGAFEGCALSVSDKCTMCSQGHYVTSLKAVAPITCAHSTTQSSSIVKAVILSFIAFLFM